MSKVMTQEKTETQAPATPTNEDIAKRAYELFLQRGSNPGYELEDWRQAEAELTAAATAAAKPRKR